MMRTSAVLALIAGVAMAIIKTLLAEGLWWPFQVVEYLEALTLAMGAVAVLRGGRGRLLAAGWAFSFGLTWSTFFHHLFERPSLAQRTPIDFGLGALLLTAILGVVLCVAAPAPAPLGIRAATP